MADRLSHVDEEGRARMVDVSGKEPTLRRAEAEGWLVADEAVLAAVRTGRTPKGDVLETARIAGILAAKRTGELVPLCHPLQLEHVDVELVPGADRVHLRATATARGRTGVEMEALTAVSVAALTLYDMLKALSRELRIEGVRLLAKSGGRSGDWRAEPSTR
jgi:cyclic pyranopterin phosphate synthase